MNKNDPSAPFSVEVSDGEPTAFCAANGTYQDGTTPMYRDVDGTLWAMSGHSHMGTIAVYKGTSLDDMKKFSDVNLNFCVGNAEYAFSGIRYPEGIKPRGSIWPFGLYICPVTHRFFCLFHNESGWNGRGTAYDSYGLCDKPRGDSDFRHVGLMHSDDEGKTWTFDRWVLTAFEPCFTSAYDPGSGGAKGQERGVISLGSGDFSIYVSHGDGYIYLFYNIIRFDMDKAEWKSCDVYVARSRIREDGVFGDFVKYYDGAFCEAGNLGRETALVKNSWHPRVSRLEKYFLWCMVSVSVTPGSKKLVDDTAQLRVSKDLVNWGEPFTADCHGEIFGNHYVAMASDSSSGQPFDIAGDTFSFLTNHNGKDVIRYRSKIIG
ncbi:MAG: hypothetical protein IJV00_04385 [Clostridia bacterium]|nr:hypothetical protein [Clostridia bacterium]